MKDSNKILSDNITLVIGIVVFLFFLLFPESKVPWVTDITSQDCTVLSMRSAVSCKLSQGILMNFEILQQASLTLKGKGEPSDIAQDIVGFRALVNKQDPYPVLGPAYRKIGIEWDEIGHASTHPPMAFLFVAPIAFLSWNWASAVWAWFMLALIVFTFRCYGVSWKAAIGLTPIVILWSPIATSLGQLTIIWLFALAAGYYFERRQQFWSGILIGLAAITKFFPSILIISFLLKKKWLALLGFVSTFVSSLLILLYMYPSSISRYIEVNQSNSIDMILRLDNSSLLINSYRVGGWTGVTLILLLFLSIIWVNKEYFYEPVLSLSPRLWILLSYFSVALLPVSWVFSLAPLLPIVIMLISRKKLSTLIVGFCSILIPCIFPPFGVAIPFALVILLIGMGLLFDGLPFKLFTAASFGDLARPQLP